MIILFYYYYFIIIDNYYHDKINFSSIIIKVSVSMTVLNFFFLR